MLKIKVCGLTDPDNTLEIALTLPDYMGFIFYPGSERYAGNQPPGSLFSNIPPGILKTGVFVNAGLSLVTEKMFTYGFDLIQLHGDESPVYCNILKKEGATIIKAFGISLCFNFSMLEKYTEVCDYFLFDTKVRSYGGSGIRFDWNILNEYTLNKQFFLGGGIGPEDVSLIKKIDHDKLFAIDINSRFESSPGIKDCKKVKDFINELKV